MVERPNIIERLREMSEEADLGGWTFAARLMREAADEIERLRNPLPDLFEATPSRDHPHTGEGRS